MSGWGWTRVAAGAIGATAARAAYTGATRALLGRDVKALMAGDRRSGERIHANRAVIALRTRSGRVVAEEAYEDAQKVAAFDARLAERPAVAA
jgi:hypothetical protein